MTPSQLAPSPLFRALAGIDLCTLDPLEFEKLTLAVFTSFGFHGELTACTGDHGVDIQLTGAAGRTYCVQCKRYSVEQVVTPREVREFLGAITYMSATEGYFVTTSRFSAQCCEFAKDQPLHLVDGQVLKDLLVAAETFYRDTSKHSDTTPDQSIREFLGAVVPLAQESTNQRNT